MRSTRARVERAAWTGQQKRASTARDVPRPAESGKRANEASEERTRKTFPTHLAGQRTNSLRTALYRATLSIRLYTACHRSPPDPHASQPLERLLRSPDALALVHLLFEVVDDRLGVRCAEESGAGNDDIRAWRGRTSRGSVQAIPHPPAGGGSTRGMCNAPALAQHPTVPGPTPPST